MAFEIYESFTGAHGCKTPSVKLLSSSLQFNKAAQKFIGDWERAILAYDRDTGQIALTRCGEGKGAKISKIATMWKITSAGFIAHFELEKIIKTRYSIEERESGLILTPVGKNETAIPIPESETKIGYMCKGCGYSNKAWAGGHPNECSKCGSTAFEKNILRQKKKL